MVDPTLGSFSNAINSPSSFLVLSYLMMAYTAHMYSLCTNFQFVTCTVEPIQVTILMKCFITSMALLILLYVHT